MSKGIYVQEGKSLDYTNTTSADIKYGDVVVLTSSVGIAESDIPKNTRGALSVSGVYEMPAISTAAFTVGQQVHWDAAAGKVTNSDTGTIPCGMVTEPKDTAATAARVKIG